MSRTTIVDVRNAVASFNEAHPDINMSYVVSTGCYAIGLLGEHGSFSPIISGSTASDVLAKFRVWEVGFIHGRRYELEGHI